MQPIWKYSKQIYFSEKSPSYLSSLVHTSLNVSLREFNCHISVVTLEHIFALYFVAFSSIILNSFRTKICRETNSHVFISKIQVHTTNCLLTHSLFVTVWFYFANFRIIFWLCFAFKFVFYYFVIVFTFLFFLNFMTLFVTLFFNFIQNGYKLPSKTFYYPTKCSSDK